MLQKMEMPTNRSMDSAPPEPFSHRRDTKTSPSQPPRLELPNRVLSILTLPSSPMSPSQHLPVPYTINSCVERSRCTKGNGGHGSGFASLLFVSLESRRLSIGPARVVLNLLWIGPLDGNVVFQVTGIQNPKLSCSKKLRWLGKIGFSSGLHLSWKLVWQQQEQQTGLMLWVTIGPIEDWDYWWALRLAIWYQLVC